MDKDAVIAVLRAHETELKQIGVRHAALFGSVARGEAGPDSDIDIAIEIDEEQVVGVYAYVGVKQQIADLFSSPVDVVNTGYLRPGIGQAAKRDMIHAF
jgi:predicted nucleotidyltransferase